MNVWKGFAFGLMLVACSSKEEEKVEKPQQSVEKASIPEGPLETDTQTVTLVQDGEQLIHDETTITWRKGAQSILLYERPKDGEGCETKYSAEVLSWVGPIVSISESGGGYCEGAAHPFQYTNWEAWQIVGKEKQKVSITNIFPEKLVLAALVEDTVVQKYRQSKTEPSTLAELEADLDGQCTVSFRQLGSTFAFHHIKKDQVAVRLGLTHGCEVERGNFTELGIYLPIDSMLDSALKEALKKAKTKGLLYNEVSKR